MLKIENFINIEGENIGVQKFDVEQIMDETNGVIYDGHYSEKGHIDLANILIEQNVK